MGKAKPVPRHSTVESRISCSKTSRPSTPLGRWPEAGKQRWHPPPSSSSQMWHPRPELARKGDNPGCDGGGGGSPRRDLAPLGDISANSETDDPHGVRVACRVHQGRTGTMEDQVRAKSGPRCEPRANRVPLGYGSAGVGIAKNHNLLQDFVPQCVHDMSDGGADNRGIIKFNADRGTHGSCRRSSPPSLSFDRRSFSASEGSKTSRRANA